MAGSNARDFRVANREREDTFTNYLILAANIFRFARSRRYETKALNDGPLRMFRVRERWIESNRIARRIGRRSETMKSAERAKRRAHLPRAFRDH